MLNREQLDDYWVEIEYAYDSVDRLQVLQRIYRAGYVAGCNDSNNQVKE